jgi:hypothetical protein
MDKVFLRSVRQGRDVLVAICDFELLGKTLEGGRVPFKVSESFYKGVEGNIDEAIKAMSRATICNIVGKNIVKAALNSRLINKNAITFLGDVPHAQIIRF